ncbi:MULTISPECIES: hypothetical protein [Frankia]|uniref:Uncharacterized protein n=1 Tax=Frankia alni (strain DSM 45986 / CECT 9034 / ACN14a) TaxID=326424 RepID=Q0RPX0_FRAAA|nr:MULTISPECIES: hypothetical protein [Frankia]CAJ60409.1 hypothetical protein FRAAL1757 [Frankia alni ACN14a]
MSLIEGDGPDDSRYRWLPEVVLPDTDGLLVCAEPVWDGQAGRPKMEADFWPVAAGVLLEAAFGAAGRPGVMAVVVHRGSRDLVASRLAMVVGLRLAVRSARRGLVLCGGPLNGLDATFQGRRPVAHEVLVWESGDVWVPRRVWEVMAPDRYEQWVSRRQILGLDRRP